MRRGRTGMVVIDPELERLIRRYRRIDHADPQLVRQKTRRRAEAPQLLRGAASADEAEVLVRDVLAGDVRVRMYEPRVAVDASGDAEDRGRPAVLYLHAGAFITGDLDLEHARCIEMSRITGVVLVSVDYRWLRSIRTPPPSTTASRCCGGWGRRRGRGRRSRPQRRDRRERGRCLAAAA